MTLLAFERGIPEALAHAESLPSLPSAALEVLRLTQDEDSTIDDLAAALSRDPVLAAKILKLANSSLFSLASEVATLQRATMVLGLKTVKLMSLSFSLIATVPLYQDGSGFDFEEFWRRSLVRSVSARSLATLIGSRQGDEAFLCGLLAHFGSMILQRIMPDDYAAVIERCSGWPNTVAEREMLGFSSSDVCATLLRTWDVPEVIYMAIGYADCGEPLPDQCDPDIASLVDLLELAGLLEGVICDKQKAGPLESLRAHLNERYGIDEEAVDEFIVGIEQGIHETADLLSLNMPAGKTHHEIMDEAKQQIFEVSLGTAVDLDHANRERDRLALEKEQLISKANTDALTGLPNRGFFDSVLEKHVSERIAGKCPLALGLVMMDIDHFKKFNDTYGHTGGDEVLRIVGEVLSEMTRKGDVTARYGGEEFAIIAPHTNPFNLRTMAERLRAAIEKMPIMIDGEEVHVTASFGGACIAEFSSTDEARSLIQLADSLLYRAKQNGRNCCDVYKKVRFPAI